MKSLKDYIIESLLDDEENIVNTDIIKNKIIASYKNDKYYKLIDIYDISGKLVYPKVTYTFNYVTLLESFYNGNNYFHYVLYDKDKIINDSTSKDIVTFFSYIVDGDLITSDKKEIKHILTDFRSLSNNSFEKTEVRDTDIDYWLNPKKDNYTSTGNLKIDTKTLAVLVEIKKLKENTIKYDSAEKTTYAPIEQLDYKKMSLIGDFFKMPLKRCKGFDEWAKLNQFANIDYKKDGNDYKLIKNICKEQDRKQCQEEFYNIIIRAQNFYISNISELYITNHKDALTDKCTRNGYLKASISYLTFICPEIKNTNDYNTWTGSTYERLEIPQNKSALFDEWIKTFNYDRTKFDIKQEKDKLTVTIKFDKL